jgi:hypothetical protein
MADVFQILGFLLLSALKFFLAPAAVTIAGYSILETILITSLGGTIGFLIFYRFGHFFHRKYVELFPPKNKRVFSPRKRKMVKYKNKYGFWGLAILTPILFGIPLGSLVAAAFFHERLKTTLVFISSIIVWSTLISIQCAYFKDIW